MKSKTFQEEFNKLNTKQKEAVEAIEGPVMIIAGPGTGKTQIIAMRIANILNKSQVNPSNILCLTFTNSGVRAMKERLLKIIGVASYQIQVVTFHSFCNEIIDSFSDKFLFAKEINQLDDLEQIEIIQNILDKTELKYIKPFKSPYYYKRAILKSISNLKQEDITPEQYCETIKEQINNYNLNKDKLNKTDKLNTESQINKNRELYVVYKKYQQYLTEAGKYDYNDMILFVLRALKKDNDLLSYAQEKYQYILVDEYQDTNTSQNEIVDMLCSFHDFPNIFVVGDDEQSIYRFQGASMENILLFKKKYPKAKIIILKDTYRSGQNILDAARNVIDNNKNQIANKLKLKKQLVSNTRSTKGKIYLAQFDRSSNEYYFIAMKIKELIDKGNIKASEIAVLYRNNADVVDLIAYLSKLNIPYKIESGKNVLQDPEIQKIIQFLKILSNEKIESDALVEVMHYPFFNLDTLDIYKIISEAVKRKQSVFDTLLDLKNVTIKYKKKFQCFVNSIFKYREVLFNNNFSKAFETIIDETGFIKYLTQNEANAEHLNRLQALFKYIQSQNRKNSKFNLKLFLENIELLDENNLTIEEEEVELDFSGVNLMTAHKSKGLEFDVVFIMHLSDKHWGNVVQRELIKLPNGLLKIQKNIIDDNEEERRIYYVTLTRARHAIYLTTSSEYGDEDTSAFVTPSLFISEISSKYITKVDTRKLSEKYEDRLKLMFSTDKWSLTKSTKKYLETLLSDFKLNPTALNNYLNCPKRFFYDNMLHIPKAKDIYQSYGTAVHFALDRFFKKYKQDFELPSKKILLDYYKEGLNDEIIDEKDYKGVLTNGTNILSGYFSNFQAVWKKHGPPIYTEYGFGYHNVHFNKIPISGRIDRIELISSSANQVRIIDYKTSSPKSLNYILGKTKEKNTDYLYQAYFYKLLTDSDPLFRFGVKEIVFDFINDGNYKQVIVPIDPKEYEKFKEMLQDVYTNILKLNFPENPRRCKNNTYNCSYIKMCALPKK
jgi:DNA helicase-2/ATP-dependent DNA helicase PcrA